MRPVSLKLALVAGAALVAALAPAGTAQAATPAAASGTLNCASGAVVCTEVQNSEEVFGEGHYIGHDEPSSLFYSNVPGSGNRMQYQITLPTDPGNGPPLSRKSFNFELHPAFWFGMAMCDTQSYPEQLSTCRPDSDRNIVDPAVSPNHPGTAFMELQFYPPGWVQWPAAAAVGGTSCDPTRWCMALNVDSLSENPVTGGTLNPTCAAETGLEYVNFAFLTRDGRATAPATPVTTTVARFVPDAARTFFMNSGDRLSVTLHDTEHGLLTQVHDLTTGGTGSMVSSAANGFGQVKFAPSPSTECTNLPYDFHPMYSTSSEQTRVIWAAHSYNVAFSDEIGHFDFCGGSTPIPATEFGASCPAGNTEGRRGGVEPTNGDDNFCFPASRSSLVQLAGCTDTNTGFDGLPYLANAWPDGNTELHATSFQFTSPLTGEDYQTGYNRAALETDLPRIEAPDLNGPCNRTTGANCTLIPMTDDGTPAQFYPYYSIANRRDQCVWMLGAQIPGATNDFGKNAGYGSLLSQAYLILGGGGAPHQVINDFRNVFANNPCPANSR
jgi:hypothetical protein